jgi:hypothetical protein
MRIPSIALLFLLGSGVMLGSFPGPPRCSDLSFADKLAPILGFLLLFGLFIFTTWLYQGHSNKETREETEQK